MRKEYLIPLLVLLLTIAFGSVCFLMFFFNNNKRLTNWKMKLGGLLLMLSSIAVKGYGQEAETSCYLVPAEPSNPITFAFNADLNKSVYNNKNNNHLTIHPSNNYNGINYNIGVEFNFALDKKPIYRPKNYFYATLSYENIAPERNLTISDNEFIHSFVDGNPSNLALNQKINISYLNLGAGYKFIFRSVFIAAGIEASYELSEEQTETVEIKDNNSIFKNNINGYDRINDRKIELSNKSINNLNKYKFDLPINIGIRFIKTRYYFIYLTGTYCLPITDIIKNENSKLNIFRIGINANFIYKRYN